MSPRSGTPCSAKSRSRGLAGAAVALFVGGMPAPAYASGGINVGELFEVLAIGVLGLCCVTGVVVLSLVSLKTPSRRVFFALAACVVTLLGLSLLSGLAAMRTSAFLQSVAVGGCALGGVAWLRQRSAWAPPSRALLLMVSFATVLWVGALFAAAASQSMLRLPKANVHTGDRIESQPGASPIPACLDASESHYRQPAVPRAIRERMSALHSTQGTDFVVLLGYEAGALQIEIYDRTWRRLASSPAALVEAIAVDEDDRIYTAQRGGRGILIRQLDRQLEVVESTRVEGIIRGRRRVELGAADGAVCLTAFAGTSPDGVSTEWVLPFDSSLRRWNVAGGSLEARLAARWLLPVQVVAGLLAVLALLVFVRFGWGIARRRVGIEGNLERQGGALSLVLSEGERIALRHADDDTPVGPAVVHGKRVDVRDGPFRGLAVMDVFRIVPGTRREAESRRLRQWTFAALLVAGALSITAVELLAIS